MNRGAFGVWIGICWVVTLGISYLVGWYKGARSVASIAVSTAHSSFNFILIALVVVALVSGFAAFKARGYFWNHLKTIA